MWRRAIHHFINSVTESVKGIWPLETDFNISYQTKTSPRVAWMHGPYRAVEVKFPHSTPRDCYANDQLHVFADYSFLFERWLVHGLSPSGWRRQVSIAATNRAPVVTLVANPFIEWVTVGTSVHLKFVLFNIALKLFNKCQNWGSHSAECKEHSLLNLTTCSLIDVHRRFGGKYFFHLHGGRINQVINQQVSGGRESNFPSASRCALLCLTLRLWRWKQYLPMKRRWICTGLHGVTPQKMGHSIKCVRKASFYKKILQNFETFHMTLLKTIRVKASIFANTTARGRASEALAALSREKQPKIASRGGY
jgi:hypothetical protein